MSPQSDWPTERDVVPQPAWLADRDFTILVNAPPPPHELRSFCVCSIDNSCQRRPRRRAPRRSRNSTRSTVGRTDDGGAGDGDPPPPLAADRPGEVLVDLVRA